MPKRNVYHPSLRAAVCLTRNPRLLPDLVPYNTAVCWIRRGPQDVVALEPDEFREALLLDRISRLERQNATLRALVVLLITVMRIIGVDLERARVPNADDKLRLLKAIKSARRALPIAVATKIIGISPARYHSWVRAEASCSLDDESSCPKSQPTRINAREINIMHTLVMAADLLHMPIRTLALYAQRTGQVVACASTWFRIIADRGWIRPRIRLYPDKPTEGIRAEKPNGLWHIDTSIVRLLDGSRAYIHAVIDNFSRRILAWTVADQGGGLNTVEVLNAALDRLEHPVDIVEVMVDGGSENFNERVDALFGTSVLERLLARSQEVVFSNSMIEAFWRSLRHQWLYLHHLDSVAAVRRLTAFYVEQHNTVMPHAAFHGQTPDEVYFGRGEAVLKELAEKRQRARQVRKEYNLSRTCETCPRAAPALLESNRAA